MSRLRTLQQFTECKNSHESSDGDTAEELQSLVNWSQLEIKTCTPVICMLGHNDSQEFETLRLTAAWKVSRRAWAWAVSMLT